MNPRLPKFFVVVLCGLLLVPGVAHASNMPMARLSSLELIAYFLWFSHWIWFPPLAALPIALLFPGRRPITDPPSRRWPDVFACMAMSFHLIALEFILFGLFTGEVPFLPPWALRPAEQGAFSAATAATLFVFAGVQAGVGLRMKRRRSH